MFNCWRTHKLKTDLQLSHSPIAGPHKSKRFSSSFFASWKINRFGVKWCVSECFFLLHYFIFWERERKNGNNKNNNNNQFDLNSLNSAFRVYRFYIYAQTHAGNAYATCSCFSFAIVVAAFALHEKEGRERDEKSEKLFLARNFIWFNFVVSYYPQVLFFLCSFFRLKLLGFSLEPTCQKP